MTNIKVLAAFLIPVLVLSVCYTEIVLNGNVVMAINDSSLNSSPLDSNLATSNITQFWNFTAIGESPKAPPVVSDGYLYMDVAGDNAYAYCLNAIWKSSMEF